MVARRLALCTWSDPSYVDPEPPAIAAELLARGHDAEVVQWDGEVDWSRFDLVVIRSTWDYFDRLEEYLAWVDRVDAASRIINSPKVIRWNFHKGYLAELGERGVPVLPMLVVRAGADDAAAEMAATGWGDVVVKPAVDGGARQALRGSSSAAEVVAHLESMALLGDVVVQPFAEGVRDGELSLLYFGGEFSHAVRKVPAPGDYRVQAHHGGAELAHQPTEVELDTARRALAHVPEPLAYARVDLVHHEGVPTVMELELIEPDLFLRMDPRAVARFADAVLAVLD